MAERSSAVLSPVVWGLCAFVLWLTVTPYIGIEHDARLYTLMAYRWLSPAAYARDPWFAFGSQDDWSLFSPIYAFVLHGLGVDGGAMATTLLAGLAYVVASICLARAMLRGRLAWLAALFLVGVPISYTGSGMLYLSEGFATARVFAIPLSLLGLTCGLRGRLTAALLLHSLALAIHPSMALGPVVVTFLHQLRDRMLGVAVVAGVFAAAGILVSGAAGYLPVLGGEWEPFVESAILVYIGPWVRQEFSVALGPVFVLLLGHAFGAWRLRRLYGVAALIAALAILFSFVASERMPVVIVMQAQFWRAIWIAKALGVVALVDLASRYVFRRHARGGAMILAYTVILAALLTPGWAAIGLWLATRCISASVWQAVAAQADRGRRALLLLAVMVIALHLPVMWSDWSLKASGQLPGNELADVAAGFFRTGGHGIIAVACWLAFKHLRRELALVLLVPALAVAAMQWDVRSPIQRDWESRYVVDGNSRLFDGRIRRGDTVYWYDSVMRVWLELGTSGYASARHATGMVFSQRRTQLLDARMIRVLLRATTPEEIDAATESGKPIETILSWPTGDHSKANPFVIASYEALRTTTAFGLRILCADRDLDFVVDPMRFDGLFVAAESERVSGRLNALYLYDCRLLRASRRLDK